MRKFLIGALMIVLGGCSTVPTSFTLSDSLPPEQAVPSGMAGTTEHRMSVMASLITRPFAVRGSFQSYVSRC
jgi:uncharacterized protein YceK